MTKKSLKSILGLLLLLISSFPKLTYGQEQLLIQNVHVISMTDHQILKNQQVFIKEGKIQSISPSSPDIKAFSANTTIIDGKGNFLLPGLSEMHSHIPITENGDFSYVQDVMWLYLANGVLNVRGMIGHPSHLELKRRIATGEITGPRIFAAGPSLNGNTVESPESGAAMVRAQKAAGYDHLKLHPGLDIPRFEAIAKTAQEVGILFGGHISLDVGLHESLTKGYKSVEHMDGYIEAMIADKERLDPQVAGPFSMLLVKEADKVRFPELLELSLQTGAWIAPTLTLFERFFGYIPADEFRLEPEMRYMPGLQVQQWVNQKKLLESQGILKEENVKPYLEFRKELLLKLHQGGVPVILSSDSPQVFNVPGFSLHNEIKSMHEAGMSPMEILKSGTVNVAKYFDREGEFGVIQEGVSADLLLVNGNPLEDLSALRNLQGIVLRGIWIDQATLQEQLKKIEQKNLRK